MQCDCPRMGKTWNGWNGWGQEQNPISPMKDVIQTPEMSLTGVKKMQDAS